MQKQTKRDKTKRSALKIGLLVVGLLAVLFGLSRLVGDDDKKEIAVEQTADTAANAGSTAQAPATESTAPDAGSAAPTPTNAPEVGPTEDLPADAPFVYGTGACAAADGSSPVTKEFGAAPASCLDPDKVYTATFDTSEGEIKVALDTDRTPGTANNFVNLARFKYYDNTPIFRTDQSIDIIQAGGENNSASTGYTIPDEGGKFAYAAGDLVMARTGAPDSAGGQFFFVAGPKASLLDGQGTYVTFGRVTTGLDVVKAILALSSGDGALGGAPSRPVTINSVTITEEAK
jgi:peptidyl-prolyl cis-trans isomerase B (cyclophilin B)